MLSIVWGIIGLLLLYYGAEFLVKGGTSIALKLKISPLVIGLTLVAYATSAPELVVSLGAALKGYGDVSMGNIVGSNICNIALILGLCAMITPLKVNKNLLQFDVWLMIFSAAALVSCYMMNRGVNRIEAACLLTVSIAYTVWSIYTSRRENGAEADQDIDIPRKQYPLYLALGMVIVGLTALIGGAEFFVDAAIKLAKVCGISDAVIGLTIISVGTSLPELATSVVAAIRKEQDIAIGNVVGSNIFNVLTILGITPLIAPVQAQGISYVDVLLMLGLSILLFPLMKTQMKISRREGAVLFIIYAAYTAYLIMK